MTTITNGAEEVNYKIIPPYNNINRQIIISRNIDGENIIWNFNADQREDVMGKITSKMDQLFNLSQDTWYKRIICDDFNSIQIIEMNSEEIQQYQQKNESNNNEKENNVP